MFLLINHCSYKGIEIHNLDMSQHYLCPRRAVVIFSKKTERGVTYKTTFSMILSAFCLYLLKLCAIVVYI